MRRRLRGVVPTGSPRGRAQRVACAALLVAALALATSSRAQAPLPPGVTRLAEVGRTADLAALLGRLQTRDALDRVVDLTLDGVSPPSTWSGYDDGRSRARTELATLFTTATAEHPGLHPDGFRFLLAMHFGDGLDDAERTEAIAFYESPGGRAWQARRLARVARQAAGLPFGPAGESVAKLDAAAREAADAFARLPAAERTAVDRFTASAVGEKLRCAEEGIAGDAGEWFGQELELVAADQTDAFVVAVRERLGDALPPPTSKRWLGTVTMEPDRSLTVVVDHRDAGRTVGRYTLRWTPGEAPYGDLLAAAPGIAPGETRQLFRDPRGRLGDTP